MKFIAIFLFFSFSFLAFGEVSTTPPEWYAGSLEARLTSFEKIRQTENPFLKDDGPGVIILSESVSLVAANGTRQTALHYVYLPLTEKGVKEIQQERFSFSAQRQKMHFIMARTVSIDGKVNHAAKEGVFLQRPEGSDRSSIYDDREDLVIIYPDVKVGSLVEVIVGREEMEPLIEGQYTRVMNWVSGWPIVDRKVTVGLDNMMSTRLKLYSLGSGIPVVEKSEEENFVWHKWQKRNIVSRPYEENRPPTSQVGPTTWISTFESWKQVGHWYHELIEPQLQLGDELKKVVNETLVGVNKPDEILAALYRLAAKEVRYTGLEFGHAGLKPYHSSEVWKRKYGDCKDKSTLLVAMLRSRGFDAWVALVNTNGNGVVHRESPGSSAFNHAITVVDIDTGEGEELVFCDSTISYGNPGVLAPSSSDRDVFIVTPDGGRFVRSPKLSAGAYDYVFDLSMDDVGRVSGWLNWKSTGYYSVLTSARYDGLDRDNVTSRLRGVVRGFFPSAEIVDFKLPQKFAPEAEDCTIRIFFTTAVNEGAQGEAIPINFTSSSALFMDYGARETRDTSYFQWQDSIQVSTTLKIAKGLVPVSLHRPLHAESPGYRIDAKWIFDEEELKTTVKIDCTKPLLEPEEVLSAQQVSRAWSRWANQPLLLKTGDDWKAPEASTKINLPVMPTGEGQLSLVDRWYPLGQDSALRRRALEKVIQIFSNDPETLYSARSSLAYLDYNLNQMEKALAAYEKLTQNCPSGVSADSFSFALYMAGYCYLDLKDYEKAAQVYGQVLEVEGISDFRRGWSLVRLAESLMRGGRGGEALSHLLAAEKIDSTHREAALKFLIHFHSKKNQFPKAIAGWQRFEMFLGDRAFEAVKELVGGEPESALASDAQLGSFLKELGKVVKKEQQDEVAKLVSDVFYRAEKLKMGAILRSNLLTLIDKEKPEYLNLDTHDSIKTREDYLATLAKALSTDGEEWLANGYGYLRRFEADENFTTFLWNFITHVEWKEEALSESEQVLMPSLITLCQDIPRQDENYWECQFIIAEWFEDREKWSEAEALLRAMPSDPHFDKEFETSAWLRRGIALERLGKWEEAVTVHLYLKDKRMESQRPNEQLMRAGWIQARLGQLDEAIATWNLLKEVPPARYEAAADLDLIQEAILLASTPEKTKSYWRRTSEWWQGPLKDYAETALLVMEDNPQLTDAVREAEIVELVSSVTQSKSREELSELATGILSGARWFPSFTERAQDLFENYIRPITIARNQEFRRVSLALFNEVDVGKANSIRLARAQALISKVMLKDEDASDYAFKLYEETDSEKFPDIGETILRQLAFLAIRDNKDREKVETLLLQEWEARGKVKGQHHIGIALAQVMVAQERMPEAIEHIKSVLEEPSIKRSAANTKAIRAYLESLEKLGKERSAFLTHLEKIHTLTDVSWLPHVKPLRLGEKGFDEPLEYFSSETSSRHPLEDYKWGYLILKSDQITVEQRSRVFYNLVDFHLNRAVKKSFYNQICDELLADEALPEAGRRIFLWKAAADASLIQMDPNRVRKYSKNPLSHDLSKELRDQGFSDLIEVAKARNEEAVDKLALMEKFQKRGPLGLVAKGCVQTLAQSLIFTLDDEVNEEVFGLWRKMQFEGADKKQGRKLAIRHRKDVARFQEDAEFIPLFKSFFREKLVRLAAKAPEDWKGYRHYENMRHMKREMRKHLFAKVILNGAPEFANQYSAWRSVLPHLLIDEESKLDEVAVEKVLSIIASLESESRALQILTSVMEIDDYGQKVRTEMISLIGAWAETHKKRILADMVTLYRYRENANDVSAKDLKRVVKRIAQGDENGRFYQRLVLLPSLLDRENSELLEMFLRDFSEEDLYEYPFLVSSYLTFRELKRADEIELVAGELVDQLPKYWMDAWYERNNGDLGTAVEAYWLTQHQMGKPAPFWLKEIPQHIPEKMNSVRGQLMFLMTEGKWDEFETLVEKHYEEFEKPEARVLKACVELGQKRKGADKIALKILHSSDKMDSFAFFLREMLRRSK